MTTQFDRTQSLGRRFSLSAANMLIPLIMLVFIQYYVFSHATSKLKQVIDHSIHEMNTIRRIQNDVHLAIMAPNDYLIHASSIEKKNYVEFASKVTTALDKLAIYVELHGHRNELKFVTAAQEYWQKVDAKSRVIFSSNSPIGNSRLARLSENMDAAADKIILSLEKLHDRIVEQAVIQQSAAEQLHVVMIGVIFGGTAISAILILWLNANLARSVVSPVSCISSAAHKVGEGKYDTRLNWSRKDELGELSRSFDEMTAHLQSAHEELERLSRKDSLTGILNRREFDRLFIKEFNRAERYQKTLSVVIIDLDHFKDINDEYGHQTGDHVLRKVVNVISDVIRDVDHFARYGGEEFVLLLPETGADEAMMLANRLCSLVEATKFLIQDGLSIQITLSAGVAAYPEHVGEKRELLLAADQALYKAKRNGRNRAEFNVHSMKVINSQ